MKEVGEMRIDGIGGIGGFREIMDLLMQLRSSNFEQSGPQNEGDPDPIGHPYGPQSSYDSVDLSDEAIEAQNGGPRQEGDPDPIGHPNGPGSSSISSDGPQRPGDPNPRGGGPGAGLTCFKSGMSIAKRSYLADKEMS